MALLVDHARRQRAAKRTRFTAASICNAARATMAELRHRLWELQEFGKVYELREAVVRFNAKDHIRGTHGTSASHDAYDRPMASCPNRIKPRSKIAVPKGLVSLKCD